MKRTILRVLYWAAALFLGSVMLSIIRNIDLGIGATLGALTQSFIFAVVCVSAYWGNKVLFRTQEPETTTPVSAHPKQRPTGQMSLEKESAVSEKCGVGGLSNEAKIALEYDEKTKEIYRRLETIKIGLGTNAIELFVSNKDLTAKAAEAVILEAWEKENSPFEIEHENEVYRELKEVNLSAAAEFKDAMQILSGRSDVDAVANKIRSKFMSMETPKAVSVTEQRSVHSVKWGRVQRIIDELSENGFVTKKTGGGFRVQDPNGIRSVTMTEERLREYAKKRLK